MQLLHLEDSLSDAELIGLLIQREWPGCQICHVATPHEFGAALDARTFDLILSDYSLPGFDGLSALAVAQTKSPATPFLFLSGTIGEERAVEALKRGATDYVIKDRPIRLVPAMRQALARVAEAQRRRRAEEKMRENEERFRQIAENVSEFIALLDADGRRVYVNPAHREIFGEPTGLLGTDAFREIHPADRAAAQAAFARTLSGGAGHELEYRLRSRHGDLCYMEAQGSAVRDGSGNVVHVLIVSRDVTARREADARLREQASLLDKARDAIIATDLEHCVTYWNPSAERLYGWKATEAIGRKMDQLALGFDAARFGTARGQLLASGEWRGDFRLRTRAGETVVVESTWSLVAENDGRPRSILHIDTDVTERKKLETQLLRAQRMESIGTLAGGIAHDLNNVLTPILLTIDMIAAKATNEEDRKIIEKTRASASHGAALVQQLLAFARGADGKRTRVDASAALRALEPLVRQSLPSSVGLVVESDPAAWPISADATQFNQVVINLCLNARDAMPQGGRITIRTANEMVDARLASVNPGVKPGAHLRLSVIDTGSGIAPGIIEKIFDPFFTTKAAGKGTGLGLSMVAGILKSHGGFVAVESELGHGTSFHLHFPAQSEPPPAIVRDPPAAAARGQGEAILLIDDEPLVRDTLQLLLQRAGYHVFAAGDAGSGLAEFERRSAEISMAISDMMLPDRSGVEVVRELRRRRPALPIIAISGLMASGGFDELLRLSPRVECLAKPLAPTVLLAAVRKALGAEAGVS